MLEQTEEAAPADSRFEDMHPDLRRAIVAAALRCGQSEIAGYVEGLLKAAEPAVTLTRSASVFERICPVRRWLGPGCSR
jgi:hypothetical protein